MKELTEEVLGRLMAYDVEWQIGAGRYERNEERTMRCPAPTSLCQCQAALAERPLSASTAA